MTAMVSTPLRRVRGYGAAHLGCVLVMATVLVGGCTRAVGGTARAVANDAGRTEPIPLRDLLIEPERFPARYPAVVLDPIAVNQALQDIVGVVAGSVVTPAECAPPLPAPPDTVAAQGFDIQDGSSLTVTVTRPAVPLRARAEQLSGCPSFTSAPTSVTVTMLAAPPVDADDSYAVDQTATSETSGSVRRTLTLVAQVADVRVSATWLQDGTPETTLYATPDTGSLDTVFTDAVLKVRRGPQP
jgi:hypothetical protein